MIESSVGKFVIISVPGMEFNFAGLGGQIRKY